jgi:ferric-dicitrate binding protein FerR (iron transport regulator)
VTLEPNQRVRYGKGRNAHVELANIVEDLAWTSGHFILEDRPLREVVDELNSHLASSVVVLGSGLEIGVSMRWSTSIISMPGSRRSRIHKA